MLSREESARYSPVQVAHASTCACAQLGEFLRRWVCDVLARGRLLRCWWAGRNGGRREGGIGNVALTRGLPLRRIEEARRREAAAEGPIRFGVELRQPTSKSSVRLGLGLGL